MKWTTLQHFEICLFLANKFPTLSENDIRICVVLAGAKAKYDYEIVKIYAEDYANKIIHKKA